MRTRSASANVGSGPSSGQVTGRPEVDAGNSNGGRCSDSSTSAGASTTAMGGDLRSDYQRAQTACFEGLGYTVR